MMSASRIISSARWFIIHKRYVDSLGHRMEPTWPLELMTTCSASPKPLPSIPWYDDARLYSFDLISSSLPSVYQHRLLHQSTLYPSIKQRSKLSLGLHMSAIYWPVEEGPLIDASSSGTLAQARWSAQWTLGLRSVHCNGLRMRKSYSAGKA